MHLLTRSDFARLSRTLIVGFIVGCIGLIAQFLFGLGTDLIAKAWFEPHIVDFFALFRSVPPAIVDRVVVEFGGFLVGFLAGCGLANLAIISRYLEWKFSKPKFIYADMASSRRRTLLLLENSAAIFLGRETDLSRLSAFAIANEKPFQWITLVGSTGIGKTRLAIEWIEQLQSYNWDAGFLEFQIANEIPPNWHPRGNTALVIDEADRQRGQNIASILLKLGAHASESNKVRVLLLGETEPATNYNEGEGRAFLELTQVYPGISLKGLAQAVTHTLWLVSGGKDLDAATLESETSGRPRAILLMARAERGTASYSQALSYWVQKLIPGLSDVPGNAASNLNRTFLKTLALSVLAGPTPTENVRRVTGGTFERQPLLSFLPDISAGHLLPRFEPKELGREILLRTLAFLDFPEVQLIVDTAISANPEAVEATLGDLWTRQPKQAQDPSTFQTSNSRGLDVEKIFLPILVKLQNDFDARHPQRVASSRERVRELVLKLVQGNIARIEGVLQTIRTLTSRRPLDQSLQEMHAEAEADAIRIYAQAEVWSDLEACAEELRKLSLRSPSNEKIHRFQALSTESAICAYIKSSRPDDVERWGKYLETVVKRFPANRNIALASVRASYQVVRHSRRIEAWQTLERWGERIDFATENFRKDLEFLRLRCETIFEAASGYLKSSKWVESENWAKKLDAAFKNHPKQEVVCHIIVSLSQNATAAYGHENMFDGLGRWRSRLQRAAAAFPKDEEMCEKETMAAYNAVKFCASANMIAEVETWLEIPVRASAKFPQNRTIASQYLLCMTDAISAYGRQGRWKEIERLGDHSITIFRRFANDSDLADLAAMPIGNAMKAYGRKQKWDEMDRWGDVLQAHFKKFEKDHDFRLIKHEVDIIGGTIYLYDKAGLTNDPRRIDLLRRLKIIARRLPNLQLPGLQDLASLHGVNFAAQLQTEIEQSAEDIRHIRDQ